MKKFFWSGILAAILVILGVSCVLAEEGVPEITVDFVGTPQYGGLEVLNSGTITFSLKLNGASMGQLDNGTLYYRSVWGLGGSFEGELWEQTGEGQYCWVRYAPSGVVEFWLNGQVPVRWVEYGPWVARPEGNGVIRPDFSTQITVEILPLSVEGFVYTWDMKAEPKWAANQWRWWDKLTLEIESGVGACSKLSWEGLKPGQKFSWDGSLWRISETLVPANWSLISPEGWEMAGGTTLAPVCLRNVYLPIVVR